MQAAAYAHLMQLADPGAVYWIAPEIHHIKLPPRELQEVAFV
jgi:hypothetical protein